jgi:hypothetical protein
VFDFATLKVLDLLTGEVVVTLEEFAPAPVAKLGRAPRRCR